MLEKLVAQPHCTGVLVKVAINYVNTYQFSHINCTHTFLYEPHHEKPCLREFRPGETQTGLLSYRS